MITHESFLRTIIDEPDNDGPRMVYSDWLEEQGDPRGEFIRIQCEIARTFPGVAANPDFDEKQLVQFERDAPAAVKPIPGWQRTIEMRKREHELLALVPEEIGGKPNKRQLSDLWIPPSIKDCMTSPAVTMDGIEVNPSEVKFHRGFIRDIACSWESWLSRYKDILASTPLRRVKFTTELPNPSLWTDDRFETFIGFRDSNNNGIFCVNAKDMTADAMKILRARLAPEWHSFCTRQILKKNWPGIKFELYEPRLLPLICRFRMASI
jgi:uncharacterized protein (TIGR02996 family)